MSKTMKVERSYDVAACTGFGFEAEAGDLIRIIDLEGAQPVDFWAFSKSNPLEFLSPEHTKPTIEKLIPSVGDAAYTNQRRAIVTVI